MKDMSVLRYIEALEAVAETTRRLEEERASCASPGDIAFWECEVQEARTRLASFAKSRPIHVPEKSLSTKIEKSENPVRPYWDYTHGTGANDCTVPWCNLEGHKEKAS